MWDALPPEARERIRQPHPTRLRLKIFSENRSLLELPWEWLLVDGQPLAVRDDIRLVRSVPVAYAAPPARRHLPLRLLFVVSNPKDERLLNVPEEIAAVSSSLDLQHYCWSVLDRPTISGFREEVERTRPDIVHYIGHAGISAGDGNIILHEGEVSHWVDSSTLCHVLPSSVRLLCLSTCFTTRNYQIGGLERVAEAPAYTALPTAIANRHPLDRAAVEVFWHHFYDTLIAKDGDAVESFHDARRATYQANPQSYDWSSFALVIRDNVGKPFDLATSAADDPARLAAQAIRTQFQAEVLNTLAEQLKVLGRDASDDVLERLKSSIAGVADLTSSSE